MLLIKCRFFTQNQVLLLLAYSVLYLLAFIYCCLNSSRDPGSYFFDPDEGYRPQYSIHRIQEVLQFLSKVNHSSPVPESLATNSASSTEKTICVGTVTVKRPFLQNLDVTVGSLLDGLSPVQRSGLSLHVLFAHRDPYHHPDYARPWVHSLIDRVLTYDNLNAPLESLIQVEKEKRIGEKSLFDCRLVFESCYRDTDAPWIMMLEDDVLAHRNWYEHTLNAIDTIMSWERQGKIKNWLHLRLFYTEKFIGWNTEDWPVYLLWSLVIVSVPAIVGIHSRRRFKSLQGTLTNNFLAVFCFICLPAAIILYFLAGRVTMQPIKPGIHVMNRHGCCSQALLFPRHQVPQLLDHLHALQVQWPCPVDTGIEDFADVEKLNRLVISPSQFQHIGAASYKENQESYASGGSHPVRGAHGVWSVGFEKAYVDERDVKEDSG
jgi:hypothetical protein